MNVGDHPAVKALSVLRRDAAHRGMIWLALMYWNAECRLCRELVKSLTSH